ncbi:hypothetical protein HHL23_05340 [Chryseobacterium sp. RP-3-3]|uniref:Polyketide cyclase / dehydrase and lipid transport n=1 Tax=Chryseobacterium antibioticum TaxID=2728847 RepID=A0A7Y0AL78_9FLAO|nr:hypothetical protein [Chryseobacterium antibioticum]NML69215.1 hypothetical protein [Chryseobacterium antibioticum]
MKSVFKKHLYLSIFVFVTLIIGIWFLLVLKGDYGVTMFFTIPISIGFIIGYIKYFKEIGVRKILLTILKIIIGLVILSLILIGCGIEGAICIIMAIPFIAFAMVIGFMLGAVIGILDERRYTGSVFLFLLVINPASYIFDQNSEPIQDTVTTEIIVNSSSDQVWKLLSTEILFSKPDFVLFEKGVSYPKSIQLIDHDGNLAYKCKTNNDELNLKIDEYLENKKVRFSLENQTVPMKEMSLYDEIDAKHLHDYFIVDYGEISLQELSGNRTKITAKTQYSYKIAPNWYWKKWSNYILDKMQGHVLNSIKKQSENE